MAWVRFDDGFFRHPKVVAAGRDARDMYTSSIFYANQNLTDGFVPEGALRIIAADAGVSSHTKSAKALLREGLWLEVDGGYQIHDYLDYQVSAASVTDKQTANKRRQQEWRDRNRNAKDNAPRNTQRNAVTNTPVTGTDKYKDKSNPDGLVNPPNPPKSAKPKVEDDPRFIEFWESYPKKRSKQDAIKAFGGLNWRNIEFTELMAALEQHKKSEQWLKDGGKFIPHPATWLNGERWNDELKPAQPRGSTVTEPRGYSTDQDEADEQLRRDLEQLERDAQRGQITQFRRDTA